MIKRGYTFTHKSFLDPKWEPDLSKGEKYADAPKARMRVTSVREDAVYYRYDDKGTKGSFAMPVRQFEREYGPEAEYEKLRADVASTGFTMPDWRPME